MNNFGSEQPFLAPPPKKTSYIGIIILGAIGLLIALAILGGIKVFHAAQSGSTAAIAVGNSFLDSVGKHNYTAAHALMTLPVQAKTPVSNIQDIEMLVEKHHGTYVSHGQPAWFIQNYNGQTSVRLTYPAQYTKSNSTVSMVVVQTDKGYQVYDTNYEF